ncbi:MAG: hypothetical protein OEZ36_05475 [Spirochaetota bacterium]|nr:hypothetical protein [Spirochaetota bacterium]
MKRRDFPKAASAITTGGIVATTPACRWFDETPVTGSSIWTEISAAQPDSITGLTLWLKADAGVTHTAGSVTQWADQSGNGNHATAGTSPGYITNLLNGKPVIRFDGTATLLNISLVLSNTISIFLVATPSTVADTYLFGSNGVASSPAIVSNYSGLAFEWFHSNGTIVDRASFNSASSGFSILSLKEDLSSDTIYSNSSLSSIIPANVPITETLNVIGAGSPGVNHCDSDIAEIIVYTRALSDNERQGVELYLSNKYTITLA